ncbi:hypothetical protein R7U59_01085 [Mesomycoplasma ovipneumoniae]|nr:hypothetical protein [Mesomycoplasma ovipneumoniae]MDW2835444.1 hypothetical protein [Mesomycoplasma ovipneumoniae]
MKTITGPNVEIFNQNVGSSRRKWLKKAKIAKKEEFKLIKYKKIKF